MGPKAKGKDVENAWRSIIEDAQLNEDTWKVIVVMIEAASCEQASIYLNKFEASAVGEKRFVVKNISRTETLFMVNQLGAEKKVKDDNLRVFEEGQAYLKEKKDIPSDIQALIIKHLILKMKVEYLFIKRQRCEVQEGLRQESTTMISSAEVRGTVAKPPEAAPPPPPAKKGKGEPEPAPEPVTGKKYNTVLRERGEEWRDRVYIDDFPKDGPSLYVAVTGFMDPDLPACLIKIGIPVRAIVQIRIDPTSVQVPSTLSRPTKRGQSQTELLTRSVQFWEDLQDNRIKSNCDDFKDTAFVIFSPPYWENDPLSDSPDKIYDELCYLMYDVQDLSRQHSHYLDNMKIIPVPEEEPYPHHFTSYKQQIEDLPLECVTIFSLLDSILQIACKSDVEDVSKSSLSTPQLNIEPVVGKVPKAETLVENVFSTLCKTEIDKKQYRITYGEEFENHKDPIVIKYGDLVKNTTFHLGNINLNNIVESTLAAMPLHNLWSIQEPITDEHEAKINFHVNLLLSCFDRHDLETDELVRLLHILACRKLYNNRSSLKKQNVGTTTITDFKKVYLKRSVLAEPLPQCPSLFKTGSTSSPSFPSMTKSDFIAPEFEERSDDSEEFRVKFLFDCPDISELVSAVEIANDRPVDHMIDDFDFFEDFTEGRAYQILHEAYNKFNCVDYKYCEVTDCIIMMFFNSHDRDGITRDEWRSHIPTPLCLQDFFDFVLEEHYDWIQDEENQYEILMSSALRTESQVLIDPLAPTSCINDTDVKTDLIIEGSLKHQDIVAAEETASTLMATSTITTGRKTALSPTSTEGEKPKTKSTEADPKKRKQSIVSVNQILLDGEIEPDKPFTGYDYGDRRVEVFGKDATFFSKDGTRVYTSYLLLIPSNLEYIILNIVPGNANNDIYIHKAVGEFVTPETLKICESFRINTKDQVMMNITKQSCEVPVIPLSPSISEPLKPKRPSKMSTSLDDEEIKFDIMYYYSFCITWPNGLITESVYDKASTTINHIKQYNLSPIPQLDEDMRCISLNGEVIIFKTSGEIEVLRPDGTYICITKYEKRIVVPDVPFDEVVADKNKKGKGKEKQSKATKEAEAEKIGEKPPEYQLYIEEFDIIEPSGIKQKWVDDYPIELGKLLIRTATDYCLGEIFSRRMDGTHILLNKDGLQISTFPNKTRIITQFVIEEEEIFPEWTDEERDFFEIYEADMLGTDMSNTKGSISQKSFTSGSGTSTTSKKHLEEEENVKPRVKDDGYISVHIIYSIEHANFTTVTINKMNGDISIDSPNNTTLVVDPQNCYKFILDSETSATFDGEKLHISYEACPKCKSYTSGDVKFTTPVETDDTTDDQPKPLKSHWLKMKDSFCKTVVVDQEGDIQIKEEVCSDRAVTPTPLVDENVHPEETADNQDEKLDGKSESSVTSHGKCQELYQAKNIRFLVLNRKLNCSELIHRSLLYQYKHNCRWLPWCSINQYGTFGDHRTLHTILTPISLTECEKWVMESKLSNKPAHLTYKDLKEDKGKGFYHWMRPFERFEPEPIKPELVNIHRLPRAFVLRTLEQQWSETDREQLKGAKELLNAILAYRRLLESGAETLLHLPIVDIREDNEKITHQLVQALGHRIYCDLKKQLEDDVQDHAKIDITTKPLPPELLEEEGAGEEMSSEKLLEEERAQIVSELEEVSKIDPIMERYWRRRAEELKEEQFYLCLLRAGTVPKYFLNILGGAIWKEVDNAADNAMKRSDRRKMKCICAEAEEQSSSQVFSVPQI